jgi:hypothetical protein
MLCKCYLVLLRDHTAGGFVQKEHGGAHDLKPSITTPPVSMSTSIIYQYVRHPSAHHEKSYYNDTVHIDVNLSHLSVRASLISRHPHQCHQPCSSVNMYVVNTHTKKEAQTIVYHFDNCLHLFEKKVQMLDWCVLIMFLTFTSHILIPTHNRAHIFLFYILWMQDNKWNYVSYYV